MQHNIIFAFLFVLPSAFGWIVQPRYPSITGQQRPIQLSTLQSTMDPNPCWQDIYDDDCAMESLFSARYVASDWIKKLPCSEGIEDCDFPEDTKLPDMRPESHPDEGISVLEFLNIKRAKDVKKEKKET